MVNKMQEIFQRRGKLLTNFNIEKFFSARDYGHFFLTLHGFISLIVFIFTTINVLLLLCTTIMWFQINYGNGTVHKIML